MAEKSPAFQFYVKEWRSSRPVMRMTFAERGMYLEMLLEQWESGSLPDCPKAVAYLLGGTVEEWATAWPTLRRKFVDRRKNPRDGDTDVHVDHDPSRRIINLRLEQVRKEQRAWKRSQKKNGRKGGLAKAAKRMTQQQITATENPSTATAPLGKFLANCSSASATASATALSLADKPPIPTEDRVHAFFQWFAAEYKFQRHSDYLVHVKADAPIIRKLLHSVPFERLQLLATLMLTEKIADDWIQQSDRSIKILKIKLNWLNERLSAWEATKRANGTQG